MSIVHASRPATGLGALLLASTALAAPSLAHAAEVSAGEQAPAPAADPGSPEVPDAGAITVTARHREEKLQAVPLAISAVSGAELTSKRIERVSEFALRVPISARCNRTRACRVSIFAAWVAMPATMAPKAASA
jgi:iron complex outermembrane receptor protein